MDELMIERIWNVSVLVGWVLAMYLVAWINHLIQCARWKREHKDRFHR